MSQAQFTIPLITVIPGQLITAALWNNEWNNVGTNLNPSGIGGYSDTDTQMQIQTAPYPGSVTSHATSLGGEIERIRYQISQILGATTPAYWYAAPPTNLTALQNITVPLGAVIDYHSATPPNNNWLLANGQAIGRSAYAALNTLYSAASYPFGSGDGSTTFNLPNYQDRISIGVNSIVASAGATAGAQTHTLTKTEAPSGLLTLNDPQHTHTQNAHNHTASDSGHTHVEQGEFGGSGANQKQILRTTSPGVNGTYAADDNSATTQSSTANITVANSTAVNQSASTGVSLTDNGGNTAHSILNPVIGMFKMIRVL